MAQVTSHSLPVDLSRPTIKMSSIILNSIFSLICQAKKPPWVNTSIGTSPPPSTSTTRSVARTLWLLAAAYNTHINFTRAAQWPRNNAVLFNNNAVVSLNTCADVTVGRWAWYVCSGEFKNRWSWRSINAERILISALGLTFALSNT